MKRVAKLALAIAALCGLSLSACALSGGPISGRVVDQATGQPIRDALVAAYWLGSKTRIVLESSSTCYHVETARTDANGRFSIGAWRRPWSFDDLLLTSDGESFNAYKPGYRFERMDLASATIYMAPYRGPTASYFRDVLGSPGWNCPDAGASRKNLYRLWKALGDEAEALGTTPEQRGMAAMLRRIAADSLVNLDKPTRMTESGRMENIDPRDRARMEEVPQ
jgi:hypothetical protein